MKKGKGLKYINSALLVTYYFLADAKKYLNQVILYLLLAIV
jgi:hypothetical protein